MTHEMKNNFYMAEDINTPCELMVTILKAHPIYPVLSYTAFAPEEYIYQLWDTIEYRPATSDRPERCIFYLDDGEKRFRFAFDIELFRQIIGFPLMGPNGFTPIPDENTLIRSINALGYDGYFSKTKDFKRKLLSRPWCVIFSILNRCLSCSNTGMDAITKPILKIFYGVAYHQEIDFAFPIWEQLIFLVKEKSKNRRRYIPYIRFLTILLNYFLDDDSRILQNIDDNHVVLHMMKTIQQNSGSMNVNPRPIPESLIQLIDQDDDHLRAYRALVAQMEPSQPREPAQSAHRSPGEGSRKGLKRKDIEGTRKEGGFRVVVVSSDEKRRKMAHDNPDLTSENLPCPTPISSSSQNPFEVRSDSPPSPPPKKKTSSSTKSLIPYSDSDSDSDTPLPPPKQSDKVQILESDPVVIIESKESTAGDDDSQFAFNDQIYDFDDSNVILEKQGGLEGEVEKINESERSGRVKRSRKSVDLPLPSPKRRETIRLEVGGSQLPRAQTQPSHSDTSQQVLVSLLHGDQPRLLMPSHLGMRVIEIRAIPPQVLTSFGALFRTQTRTLIIESNLSDFARLCGVAGTRLETMCNIASQGYLGNPAIANTAPALIAGPRPQLSADLGYERSGDTARDPMIYERLRYERSGDTASTSSVVVSGKTGTLSEPVVTRCLSFGLSDTLQRLYFQRFNQLPQFTSPLISISNTPPINSQIQSQTISQTVSQITSQTVSIPTISQTTLSIPTTSIPTSQPTFFTTSPQTTQFAPSTVSQPSSSSFISYNTMSLQEIEVLYHARLLTSPVLTPTRSAILSLLNNQPTPPSSSDISQVVSRLNSIDLQMMSIHQRLNLVEQSCRPSAFSKINRRHDDPDSGNNHEGEKQAEFNVQTNVEKGSTQTQDQEQRTPSDYGSPQDDEWQDYQDFDDEEQWEPNWYSPERKESEERSEEKILSSSPSFNDNDDDNNDEEFVYPSYEPLNVIYPSLMIEYNKEDERQSEDIFQQDISMATEEEGKESFIIIDSDEDETIIDDVIIQDVKEEEEEETEMTEKTEVPKSQASTEPEAVFEHFDDLDASFRDQSPKSKNVTKMPSTFGMLFDEEGVDITEDMFEKIKTPNEKVIEDLQKEAGRSSEVQKSKKRKEGKFFKSKDVQLDLKTQQLRSVLRQPFIEEQAWKIYSDDDFVPHKFNIIAGYLLARENKESEGLLFEYQTLMRRMMSTNEKDIEEQRKHKIKIVFKVDCVKLARIIVPRFHVYRMNNKRYVFSEADFHILPIHDIMFIYDYLSNAILKPWETQIASSVVKRYMKALIETSAFQDFQLGLEAVKRKINLTKPNQTLSDYDLTSLPVCMVFVSPERGFILRNGRGRKIFIRLDELHKYSDGTLNLALDCFHTLLDSKEAEQDQVPLIKETMKLLRKKIMLRKQIRQVEICRGVRKKMFYKGSQLIEGYNSRKRKEPFDPLGPYLPNDPRLIEPKPED